MTTPREIRDAQETLTMLVDKLAERVLEQSDFELIAELSANARQVFDRNEVELMLSAAVVRMATLKAEADA